MLDSNFSASDVKAKNVERRLLLKKSASPPVVIKQNASTLVARRLLLFGRGTDRHTDTA
jgi:hypothetical protein